MRERELEKRFCPAGCEGFREVRQRRRSCAGERSAAFQRTVHEHRDALLLGERQQTMRGIANANGVRQLHEIYRLATEDILERLVARWIVVGDADVTHASTGLPFPERRQVRAPVDEIVHLHQIDALASKQSEGLLHLPDPGFAATRPHLGRYEELAIDAELRAERSGDFLGATVHR